MVFFGSAGIVVAFTLYTLLAPDSSSTAIGEVVAWISDYFGWWYFALSAALIAFVLIVCLSRFGRYRLGPEESRPEYSMFTWTAMLFAAGIGADVMFYSVAEPVSQYLYPPTGEAETVEAAEQAVTWTLFHYGVSGWAMYAVMGMALGYFAFRHGMPLSIRSALYPIFGKRVHGRVGDGIDIAAVLGTIFGIATSLGISIALLNVGLDVMWGIDQGKAAQFGLVVVAVVLATISAVSGVDKGIRRISELNVLLSLALMLFVLFSGQTAFLLNSLVMNVGDYLSHLPGMSFDTMAYEELGSSDVRHGRTCGRCSSGRGGWPGRRSSGCSLPGSRAAGRSASSWSGSWSSRSRSSCCGSRSSATARSSGSVTATRSSRAWRARPSSRASTPSWTTSRPAH